MATEAGQNRLLSRKAAGTILTSIGVVSIALYVHLVASHSHDLSHRMTRGIEAAIENKSSVVMDIASIAGLDWESVFIFGPYATQDDVDAALGFEWQNPAVHALSSSDTECLLAFVKNGNVARYARIPRKTCDFSHVANRHYSRADAVFEIELEKPNGTWRNARWSPR